MFIIAFTKEVKKILLNKNFKLILSFLIIYMIINLIVFRLVYPGNWGGDELWMLPNVMGYNIISAQHWIVAYFYIISFMLFPAPIGVFILFHVVVIYILMYTLRILCSLLNEDKFVWFLLIPICTGNVLLYNFYPLRCSIYGWLLILFYMAVFKDNENPIYKIIISSVLICSLRSEGIIWLIVVGLCLYIKTNTKKAIIIFSIILLLAGAIIKTQNNLFYSTNGDYNLITAVLDPMKELTIKEYEETGEESEILKWIDETIDIHVLINNGGTGMGVLFSHYEELFRNKKPNISPDFFKGYLKLIIKYPMVYLNERKGTFIQTMKRTSEILCNNTEITFEDDMKEPYVYVKHLNGFYVKNKQIRNRALDYLSLRKCNSFVKQLCTGLIIPIGFILIGIVINIKCKKYNEMIFLWGLLLYTMIVILTMPGVEFMYFYPIYLFGCFYGFYNIINFLDKRAKK